MKGERFLNVRVPVTPFVAAGKLVVLMRHAVLFEMCVESTVGFQQKILRPAINFKRGPRLRIALQSQGERIVAAHSILTEDAPHFVAPSGVFVVDHSFKRHGARM